MTMLRLLKEDGVGLVYIGMDTIDAMEPAPLLMSGMKELWWSVDRHRDYTFTMEYDAWESVPMHKSGPTACFGEIALKEKPATLDLVTVHQHTAGGSTLTTSSPLVRAIGGR